MRWKKLGLVFDPRGKFSWADKHALQPTPLILEDRIRVFVGLRDGKGVSRVGYVDLDKTDPTRVLGYSAKPVLDIGEDGCFDDNGVVPSAVVVHDGRVFMYYAGYQLGAKVRFLVLGGLAISEDGGETFQRYQRVPVFERTRKETLFRVPHTVVYEGGYWKVWYGGGNRFAQGGRKTLPIYDIRYLESTSPTRFPEEGTVVLETAGEEYRLGRPFVFIRAPGQYYMFYGYSTEQEPYRLGYAESGDLKSWTRRDADLGLPLASEGWDSQMMAYPSVIQLDGKVYMFYNGNNYGEDGFGAAELLEW